MKIKTHSRVVPGYREANDRFRVKYGDRQRFDILEVHITRELDGSIQTFYFRSRELPDLDSIHFNTSIINNRLKIKWRGAQPINSNWKIYTQHEIENLIIEAISDLQKRDAEFLDHKFNINERSVTHRLGMYLAKRFPHEDVDCEYNREYNEETDEFIAKNLDLPKIENKITLKDLEARTVFPDIIVHRRNTDRNLLVIEVKMAWKADKYDFDLIKAKAYKYQLHYDYSVFLRLGPGLDYKITWI